MAAVPRLREPGRVAAIGLGVGTLAAYVQPGQQWTFYEIDPAIERIARDERYFTFLGRCGSPLPRWCWATRGCRWRRRPTPGTS